MLLSLFLCFLSVISIKGDSYVSQRFKCYSGTSQTGTGCWIIPNECYTTDTTCMAALSWTVNTSSITFTMAVYNDDLIPYLSSHGAYYIALGLSLDQNMGDDTVFICATNSIGNSTVYTAWNDRTNNYRLYEATQKLMSSAMVSAAGKMTCQWTWDLNGYTSLSPSTRQQVHDLSDSDKQFHLLLARGPADPYTFQVLGHSVASGNLYPFISTETVCFCDPVCGNGVYDWVTDFEQDHKFPQNIRQRLTIIHAMLMLLATFVFFPTGIMIARFGKDYLHRCCNSFIWFHLHRIFNLLGFISVSMALFLIFYQSKQPIYSCSNACETATYFHQLHAYIGTITYSLTICQVVAGFCRPGVTAESRKAFNWFHTFIGYLIWIGCCSNIFLSLDLQKFSLTLYYGRLPSYVIITGLLECMIVFIIIEWIVHAEKFEARDPDRIERFFNPNEEFVVDNASEEVSFWPILWVSFNLVTGLMVTLSISLMLVKTSNAKGFKF